jgi:hypothetical protein
MVAVAQLVESRIVIPVVVGSSPISHPSKIKACSDASLYFAWIYLIMQFNDSMELEFILSTLRCSLHKPNARNPTYRLHLHELPIAVSFPFSNSIVLRCDKNPDHKNET